MCIYIYIYIYIHIHTHTHNFKQIPHLGAEFHVDGQTGGQQTDSQA